MHNNKGFTLIELLIVVAIIGIVAAIAIPNLLVALQRGKQKSTMGEMKTIGTALGSYEIAFGMFPNQVDNGGLGYLEPHFLKHVVRNDGWSFTWHYSYTGNPYPDHYSIGSGGKMGIFSWDHSAEVYNCITLYDFEKDIILSEGLFTYAPRHR